MHEVSAALLAVLLQSHRPAVRLSFLTDLDTVLHEVPSRLLSGSVSIDRTRSVPRSAQVQIVDDDGLYLPVDSSSLVWPHRLVRVERGAYVGTQPQYVPLITGLLDDVDTSESGGSVGFAVWSRLRLADQQFSAPVSFNAGTRLADVVRSVCESAGLGADDDWYDLDDGGATLTAVRTFDVQENMLRALGELALAHGCGLGDDGLGRTTLSPFPDLATAPSVLSFAAGQYSLLTSLGRRLRATGTVYNRAIVVGVAPDRYPIRAEARDLNPLSPTYNPEDGSGPIGDRPAPPYVSADIHTQGQANAVALRLLYEGALLEEVLDARAIPVPGLECDVVTFTGTNVDDTYLLDSVSFPLGEGDMGMTVRKLRSLI